MATRQDKAGQPGMTGRGVCAIARHQRTGSSGPQARAAAAEGWTSIAIKVAQSWCRDTKICVAIGRGTRTGVSRQSALGRTTANTIHKAVRATVRTACVTDGVLPFGTLHCVVQLLELLCVALFMDTIKKKRVQK